jgi:hypothetical protein
MASQLFHPVRPQKHAAELSPQTSENSSFLRSWTRKRREARALVPLPLQTVFATRYYGFCGGPSEPAPPTPSAPSKKFVMMMANPPH